MKIKVIRDRHKYTPRRALEDRAYETWYETPKAQYGAFREHKSMFNSINSAVRYRVQTLVEFYL